jgi:hypothetical protein
MYRNWLDVSAMRQSDPPEGAFYMIGRLKWLRLGAMAILLALLVSSLPNAPTLAQDTATETPTDEEASAAATGLLTILTTICSRDDQPGGTISVVASGGTDGLECTTGDPVSLSIDDGAAADVPNGTQISLAVGSHTITESTQGSSLTVEIADGAETIVEVSTSVAPIVATETPVATDTPAPTATATMPALSNVRIVTHLCREGVDRAALETDLDWTEQVLGCPALTLPVNYGDVPADYTSANDPDNPLSYNLTFAYEAESGAADVQIADAAFANGQICEEDFGVDLNGVAGFDHCWDLSGYQVSDIAPGAVVITAAQLPEGYTFGIARTDPASDDADALAGTDPDAGTIQIDTTVDGDVVVHLFTVPLPAENQVTIISHLCPAGIESRSDFNTLADHWARLNACPSIVRADDVPASGGVTAGPIDFRIEVEGADGLRQQLADVPFDQRKVCESELPSDINANPEDDVCLDLSRYEFGDVAQGAITVRAAKQVPVGTIFVGISFVPGSGDELTQLGPPPAGGTIKLDTAADGHVTLHVFYGPQPAATATPPPSPTPTTAPTRTPTRVATRTATPTGPAATSTPGGATKTPTATNTAAGTGSLQIFKLWCEGDESLTRINVLAPGQEASRSDLGDATCANGNTDFLIFDANGSQIRAVTVQPIGVLLIDGLPATDDGVGPYSIRDTHSNSTGTFEIESGNLTRVISLEYEDIVEIPDAPLIPTVDLGDDPPPDDIIDDGYIDDEEDFPFDGPVAIPDGSDPFTVIDDPEAEARVGGVDTFEELPGVGIGPDNPRQSTATSWLFVLLGAVIALICARLRLSRLWRVRS